MVKIQTIWMKPCAKDAQERDLFDGSGTTCFVFYTGKVMDEEKLRGGVRFIDQIPRNELGKIVRSQLVKLLVTL